MSCLSYILMFIEVLFGVKLDNKANERLDIFVILIKK